MIQFELKFISELYQIVSANVMLFFLCVVEKYGLRTVYSAIITCMDHCPFKVIIYLTMTLGHLPNSSNNFCEGIESIGNVNDERKEMRSFGTQGRVSPEVNYIVPRTAEIADFIKRIKEGKYVVLFAPRQTGKTTFFRFALDTLTAEDPT